MFGFGKKKQDERTYEQGYKDGKREANEKSVASIDELKKAHNKEVKSLEAQLSAAKDKIESLEDEVEQALQSSGKSKTKVDNSPLSDKEKKAIKKTRAKLLDDIESIVRNTSANSVRGASIVKENGEIKLKEIGSKDEALQLIDRAKKGEIKIIM